MALRSRGFRVEFAEDGEELVHLAQSASTRVIAVLLDLMMPRKEGLQALRELRKANPDLPLIVLSSTSSPADIIEAMQQGANDFLVKPVTHDELCRSRRR